MSANNALNALAREFQRHWLAVFVGFLLVYSLLPFTAPALMKAGLTNVAQVIYGPYKLLCHTYGFRSFFLFGEQFNYPRGDGPGRFDTESGISTVDFKGVLAARDFQGNDKMGYKVALCERDIAMYLTTALNGIAFAFVRKKARPLPWIVFIIIGLGPIAFDGFSQLLSQPPFNFIAYRESTLTLRLLTGVLFGTALCWTLFPIVQGSLSNET
jgi:uncharacterized membrane protein